MTESTTNIEVVTDDQWNKLKIYYGYHGHDLENASANEKNRISMLSSLCPFQYCPKAKQWYLIRPFVKSAELQPNEEHENCLREKPIEVMKLKKDANIEDVISAKAKPN